MKTITIHYTTPYIGTIAKQGEHNQTELVFYLPDSFDGADFVNAEIVKRDGSTSVVDQLIPNNGVVAVPLTQDLTNVDGKMEIQLVAYKVDGTEITEIAKSGIFTCKIRKSLNVLYGEDQPGVIERILAFISFWAEKLPEMWEKKHWHDNKTVLDDFSESNGILQFDGHAVPQFPINDVEPTTQSDDYTVAWLKPNIWHRFGSADSPVRSISILELEPVDNTVAEEYIVEFWTGATAPSPVIFPSDVEWPDGSEPLWQAEKHYQVSIVNNVGLWCESEEVDE